MGFAGYFLIVSDFIKAVGSKAFLLVREEVLLQDRLWLIV
jgi:hypothetical protein